MGYVLVISEKAHHQHNGSDWEIIGPLVPEK